MPLITITIADYAAATMLPCHAAARYAPCHIDHHATAFTFTLVLPMLRCFYAAAYAYF